eukprot:553319_1
MSQLVSYIGVLRANDRVCVASYSPLENNSDARILKEVLAKPSTYVEPRRRYTQEGALFSIHFTGDEDGRVYACVTAREYPSRVAFAMLEEMETKFLSRVGEKSLTAKEGSLSRAVSSSFREICTKFDDYRNVDRLASVQAKVDVVKSTMEQNIQQMLANEEKLDNISENAENLNEQARVFQNRSTALRRQMKWKALKMWLLIALLVAMFLAIVIAIAVTQGKK